MTRNRLSFLLFVTLFIGFGAGVVLGPVIMQPNQTMIANVPPQVVASGAPRGTQFFEANIGEAQQVITACRNGTIRGDECTNAETALITVESKERFKRFRADQR